MFLQMPASNKEKSEEERHHRLVHVLPLCQQCGRFWSRDIYASLNIARLTKCAMMGTPRPHYLSRE